ncbi:TraG-like protein, N-terminal region [Serratia ficaria]|uniref:TraG-like protein, N-terminal region n=1 Tax=Serratia ficaria TaxID=61651 RepID=A0A240CAS7_SERFI|nr:TraG-like protein, N-terminal region [Serratia ficaria]CAI1086361.1 TraG-like protein, N-terminal region [Serratia ficaria]CAI1156767.1 TraG-like protein, N-terminal region [Serratia ficaria]CAI2091501.1 TraG-like protein, N-terminal region [Serratia ficaria]SNW05087.1 TraG-like protein, N-terminal region [Serratia ficaria]
MAQVDPGVMLRMSAALKMIGQPDADYKEAVVRRLVSPDNLTVSQGGRAYAGYGGNADFTLDNSVNRIASMGGTAQGSLVAYPAFDAMRRFRTVRMI